MKIQVSRTSKESIYRQLAREITERITSGLLKPGDSLPSVRKLAKETGVGVMTVVKAYGELEAYGWILCEQGKRCKVSGIGVGGASGKCWQDRIQDYIPRAHYWNLNKEWPSKRILHLCNAYVHHTLMPEAEVKNRLLERISMDMSMLYEYGPLSGDEDVRNAVSTYFGQRGVDIPASELLVVNGSQQGITLAAETFIGSGDIVLVESPTFMVAIDAFRKRGARIIEVPMDEEGMMTHLIADLCEGIVPKIIYTIPKFQNPTGISMSRRRMTELLEIAKEYNCLIIEDDPWSELSFSKESTPSLKQLDEEGRVIQIKGFSKFLLPGCRFGVVSARNPILQKLVACKAISDLGSPLPVQRMVLPLLDWEFSLKYLNGLNKKLKSRLEYVVRLLEKNMPPSVSWTTPKGGPNIWITFSQNVDTEVMLDMAIDKGISFLPGMSCFSDHSKKNNLRLSFSYLSDLELDEAMQLFIEVVHQYLTMEIAHEKHDIQHSQNNGDGPECQLVSK